MTKPIQSAKVEEIPGEVGRYRVASRGRPAFPHTVDIFAERGQGQCDCADFCTAVTRNRKLYPGVWHDYGTPTSINPLRTACRHIHLARKRWMMRTLPDMAARIYPKDPT